MQLVTAEEIRKIDKTAIEQFGIPEMVLMENAGRGVADFLQHQFPDILQKKIVIVCGTGNNGGDGLVIARYLNEAGVSVKVFLQTGRELSDCARQNRDIYEKTGGKIILLDSENNMHLLKVAVNYCDIFVDAMLGTGISRDVEGQTMQIIDVVNRRNCMKVAVDIPSGLNADTGAVWGKCLKADYTVTLALPKWGLYLNKGQKFAGEVTVVDIGIPKAVYNLVAPFGTLIEESVLQPLQQPRNRASHKGTYGHLLLLGGSMGMSGSITLSAQAASRSGVGLISCCVPEGIQQHVAMLIPEAMVMPLPGPYRFHESGLSTVKEMLSGKRAVVAGPGMGADAPTGELVKTVLQSAKCPVVIDADGLNTFAEWKEVLQERTEAVILTPHPGEMARLIGKDTGYIQANRVETAKSFAMEHHVWVVLKGANTIIASPEGNLWLNGTDSPALATGGSGDVLAGILGALLAQGLASEEACCGGVFLHGAAGVMVEQEIGAFSSKAGDIVQMIPAVLKQHN